MVDLLIFDTVTTTVYHTVRHNSTSAAVLAREILSQIIVPSRFFLTADKIPTKTPEISDGMSALETGSFAPSVTESMTQEDEDDYLLEAMLEVNDDDELEFNIDDDIEEDFGKYSAANVSPNNNIILNGTKVFFTGGEGDEPGGDGTEIEGDLIIPVNSDEVDCAKSGISLGKFLSASVSSCKPNVEQ